MTTNDVFGTYFEKSDDELFELIGEALEGDVIGFGPSDRRRLRKLGRSWFEEKRREMQATVCHHPRLQGFLGTSGSDRLVDAAAIYEVLQKIGDDLIAAPLLAVLIARVGLGEFCRNAPEPS
jgi:hypothetical protein